MCHLTAGETLTNLFLAQEPHSECPTVASPSLTRCLSQPCPFARPKPGRHEWARPRISEMAGHYIEEIRPIWKEAPEKKTQKPTTWADNPEARRPMTARW